MNPFYDSQVHAEKELGSRGTLGLLARVGSRAYGTDHSDSDHDFRGFYVAPLERVLSPFGQVHRSIRWEQPHDTTLHEVGHFFSLAAAANPILLETLFADEWVSGPGALLVDGNPVGRFVREHRSAFLSKRLVRTYGGYAVSQLEKAQRGTGGSRGQDHHKRMKFKLHTLRLLDCGYIALTEGYVPVKLSPGRVHDLRLQAERPMDDVAKLARAKLRDLDNAALVSKLPDEPDTGLLGSLLYKIRMAAV